jgi:purine-binding chemotaxis protein CheW
MDMIADARRVAEHEAARSAAAMGGEFLTFRLGGEEYGIDILKVLEVRAYEAPARIANVPSFIKGVVYLRGVIVPIVDLRLKFGCKRADYNKFTVVIVLNVRGCIVGAVVDSVADVLALEGRAIDPAPETGSAIAARFIIGVSRVSGRMLILMDIEGLMTSDEIGVVDGTH